MTEFFAAIEGAQEFHGGGKQHKPASVADLDELIANYGERGPSIRRVAGIVAK